MTEPPLHHIAEPLRPLAFRVTDLVCDPRNARRHPGRNLDAIKASLSLYGQRKPLVVRRDGFVVEAGNGTLEAAKALGWTHVAAVLVDDDPVTATGYALADNRTAELALWDDAALARLLQELEAEHCDLNALGWSDDELAQLLADLEHDLQALDTPAPSDPGAGLPPQNPVSEPGELYCLGPHRLLCGDATSLADVARLLDGATPSLMVTDPPYGVNYNPEWRTEYDRGVRRRGKVRNDDRVDWSAAWELFPGEVAYVWHSSLSTHETARHLVTEGFELRAHLVWNKQHFAFGRGHYHWKHEPCWYAVRKGKTASWIGDRSQSTVWDIANACGPSGQHDDASTPHSTQKPLECMERPIRHHEAALVYDPFLGSGTTLIAAERQGRVCLGLELDPAYCDVIRKRWGDYARAHQLEPGDGAL